MKRLLEQTLSHLTSDGEGRLTDRVRAAAQRASRYVQEVARAKLFLGDCNTVGEGVRIVGGRTRVDNRGHISLGDRVCFLCEMGPTVLRTAPGAELRIGAGTILNFGCLLSAHARVDIGDGVSLGQYCMICDTEGVDAGAGEVGLPIEIGEGAWLAARVTVLPGAKIGRGSVITAGSIVSGVVPDNVVAGGIPARVLRPLRPGETGAAGDLVSESNGSGAAAHVKAAVPQGPPEAAPRPASARGYIVSDFTIGELERRLNATNEATQLDFEAAPFDQVVPSLLGDAPAGRDVLVVWTRPEAVVPAFDALLSYQTVDESDILKQVDDFCELIVRAAGRYRTVFVVTWVVPPYRRTLGMLDAKAGGATRALAAMNLRLMDRLTQLPNTFVLNAQRWTELAGRNAQQPKLWYMGKVPFHADVFAEAASDIRSALNGLAGGARKLLVLDLDDTLWGGIVGDAGYENLRLGGHDGLGEAFVDFQRAIKHLKRRGIVLALVSKNTESVALEAIRCHPEMVLREEDFVAWRINWNDKARNIAELVTELNLGMQSVVFIDDNPVERARVREALPEVFVPEWPEDKLLYASTFRALRCFDAPAISREDAERSEMYAAERKRETLKVQVGSLDDWLKSLDMSVTVSALNASNLTRTVQLLNKTNQMNLRTRRVTEAELTAWAGQPDHELWTISVADRFGEAGLTGVVSIEYAGDVARVQDFVLSCRVMGRKVEETLVHLAVSSARRRNAARVEANYLETKKNKPCLEFWQRSGFAAADDATFVWNTAQAYGCPEAIRLIGAGAT